MSIAIGAVLILGGCAGTGLERTATDEIDKGTPGNISPLPTGAVIDYQLGGAYTPADGVGGVARDSTAAPAGSLYSICYVNGFQTQPADRDAWLADRPDLVLQGNGKPIIDENWPDELILDASTDDKRQRIAVEIATTLDLCAAAGFDAIEIDNLDSYTRSDGRLDQDGAMALATLYVEHAHAAGLAIAQKNSVELGSRGRDEAGFDFAVAEECYRYDECALYREVWGDHFVDIEYTDDLRGTFGEVCADEQVPASTILRDRDLTTPSDPQYHFAACPLD
ncbi:endo alpha-1,4 polygalactosaminidase [Pengzhenrongella sicca]|uniref:endo alpha-1,4 polygalactosaminidase n=1 Tax=Pengzhenrongella sicca TaxID=2819238 RepID=UPI001D0C8D57|nr:endo alpha-1,4 polygalactosaminidase [Pengzhenrongella sicca]